MGRGTCSFTNLGDGKGALCGTIVVMKNAGGEAARSSMFCSGQLEPSTTKAVDFSIVGLDEACEAPYGESWMSVCAFTFVDRGDGDKLPGPTMDESSAIEPPTDSVNESQPTDQQDPFFDRMEKIRRGEIDQGIVGAKPAAPAPAAAAKADEHVDLVRGHAPLGVDLAPLVPVLLVAAEWTSRLRLLR